MGRAHRLRFFTANPSECRSQRKFRCETLPGSPYSFASPEAKSRRP